MPRFRLCQHTKDDGELCRSPAMRRKNYCYFHLEVVKRRRRLAMMARTRQLLAEGKLHTERILALKSFASGILTPYSQTNPEPSRFCAEEGGGGEMAAD